MYRRIIRTVVLSSLTALMAVPAVAQIRADIGPLHIRIVSEAPPRARYERRPPRPHREDVWIAGYWDRRDDQWAWLSGRWERPGARNTRWIRPQYRRDEDRWRYEPGHWSNQRLTEGDDYREWKRDRNDRRNRNRRRN